MRKNKKQQRLPFSDDILKESQKEIMDDLRKRIDKLTGHFEEIVEDNKIMFETRNMVFATLEPVNDYVKVTCNLPYDRILDMSSKCEVQPYAAEDKTDIVIYDVKTKFDVQYAVSIVQQSFIYRKRLKL